MTDRSDQYPNMPPKFDKESFDEFLVWAFNQRVSDITIQSEQPIWCDIHGVLRKVNRRDLGQQEVIDIVKFIYGDNGGARLKEGHDFDVSYVVKTSRTESFRFRVNATSIMISGRDGIQITLRALPGLPPSLDDQMVEDEIRAGAFPDRGIVLVTGPTGSGKSTLLAGIVRHILSSNKHSEKILEYSAPIEFTYDFIDGDASLIAQSEIPRNIRSFSAGIRNALRRKPTKIIVGEARDAETMAAAAEAALTGHGVYSTVHSDSVRNTIRRMVMTFSPSERAEQSLNLMEAMQMIVSQTLVPKIGGGRIALREYLVFTDQIRAEFLNAEPENWPSISLRIMRDHGQSRIQAAQSAFYANLITFDTLDHIQKRDPSRAIREST